jgi:multicomponent Na+:H+ antiporter subunit E
VQFVVSNALVAREIVARRSRVRTGIVACPLRTESEPIITLLANVLALSPGTMPVDVQTSPPVIHLHVLVLRDVARARRDVARLEELAVGAFGSDEDVARLSTPPALAAGDEPGGDR